MAPTPRPTAAHPDHAQAARRARRQCVGHHPQVAAEAGPGGGNRSLHAAGAGPDGGRPRQPDAVPIHDRRAGFEGAECVGAATGREAEDAARAARRGQRPAERRAGAHAQYRPRHGVAAGHHAADDRRYALRCVRPAPGLHHLHAVDAVPRGARSVSEVAAQRGFAEGSLRADGGRRPGAAQRLHPGRAGFGSGGHQPPGAVSLGDALV